MTNNVDPKTGIQILSDLHLEFFEEASAPLPSFPVTANILVIAGDLGIPWLPYFSDYLYKQSERYEHIIYVAGNHEFYNIKNQEKILTINMIKKEILDICQKKSNIHFLDNSSIYLNGCRFLGTTLWSFVPNEFQYLVQSQLNDYHMIYIQDEEHKLCRKITTEDTNHFYQQNVAWLKQSISLAKKNNEKVVVITHHAPLLFKTSEPQYSGQPTNYAFASDQSKLMGPPVEHWIYGHTHYNNQQEVYGTNILSNQFGYYGHNTLKDFRPSLNINF